jgi:hypothetical protein
MTKEYMDKLMERSEQQCPNSILDELGKLSASDFWAKLPFAVKHFMMRAFATSGFTLWTW